MPQTTVLPEWKDTYPILAPAQKPGGVTVSTTLISNAVPNKPQPWTGTIITAAEAPSEELPPDESIEAPPEEEVVEPPPEEPPPAPAPTRARRTRR
jgi:hypothetical protein